MKHILSGFAFAFCLLAFHALHAGNNAGTGKIIKRTAQNTLTPVLLNKGDVLEFTLKNGQTRRLQLLSTDASVMRTNVRDFHEEYDLQNDGGTICEFSCKVLIDGHEMTMQRYLPTQESYYEPYVINGMRIWFDAAKEYFRFFSLKHGWCEPRADARFAVSDATDPVAPDLAEWYPVEKPFLNVNDSYLGDDVWMGPYLGVEPHGGMDVNTPKGTPLFTPVEIAAGDDQWLEVGFEPKPYYWAASWMARKHWPNGAEWTITFLHLDKYLVEENIPLNRGTQIAEAAGTGVGAEEHTHFEFMIRDEKENTVDGRVMVLGNIVSESEGEYEIKVADRTGKVPKSSALYIRRDDRPADVSVFMVEKSVAERNSFNHQIPQILLDPWILQWQMFENFKDRHRHIKAHFAPVSPVKAGEGTTFNNNSSRPGTGASGADYYWTFGDGGFSTEKNPTHTFASPGIYPVSLLVDDGRKKARYTQHITVDGEKTEKPVLSLAAPGENSFNIRKDFVMDVYGTAIHTLPHVVHFSRRNAPAGSGPKTIEVINSGGGLLDNVQADIEYLEGSNWASVTAGSQGNDQKLLVDVNADRLPPGTYKAVVRVSSENAVNSPQSFIVLLDVIHNWAGNKTVTVDNESKDFYATPYFWVGSRFKRWIEGYKGFYLTNGGRNLPGEYVRFTPDLKKGKYTVSFADETPFTKSRIKTVVHHAKGDTTLWVEPLKSRTIGEFEFRDGRDGYVQLIAEGSEGEVLADAVKFIRSND